MTSVLHYRMVQLYRCEQPVLNNIVLRETHILTSQALPFKKFRYGS